MPTKTSTQENVVLVDQYDNEIGTSEKLAAHLEGRLHRAVSVFIFNKKGELLIQQRAYSKYHSGGLWSNTCCSHPRPGESPLDAAHRRLWEEMGIQCELKSAFTFLYKASLDKGIIEHELDHVFLGEFEGNAIPNPLEAASWKWIDAESLTKDIAQRPELYTYWFKVLLPKLL